MARKHQYIFTLNQIKKEFTDDSKSQKYIDYLIEKVEKIEEENVDHSSFTIPSQIQKLKEAYLIYSDGACRENPGAGAWGTIIQKNSGDVLFELSAGEFRTTNNRMELTGSINGLKQLYAHFNSKKITFETDVFVYSDSKYVIDGIEKWVIVWKKKGWKKSDGKVPENIELWKELDEIRNNFINIKFLWVKGHSGHPQNEYCDLLANKAIDLLLKE